MAAHSGIVASEKAHNPRHFTLQLSASRFVDLFWPKTHIRSRSLLTRLAVGLGGQASSGQLCSALSCLNAVLELDPENGPATRALPVLDQERPES